MKNIAGDPPALAVSEAACGTTATDAYIVEIQRLRALTEQQAGEIERLREQIEDLQAECRWLEALADD